MGDVLTYSILYKIEETAELTANYISYILKSSFNICLFIFCVQQNEYEMTVLVKFLLLCTLLTNPIRVVYACILKF